MFLISGSAGILPARVRQQAIDSRESSLRQSCGRDARAGSLCSDATAAGDICRSKASPGCEMSRPDIKRAPDCDLLLIGWKVRSSAPLSDGDYIAPLGPAKAF